MSFVISQILFLTGRLKPPSIIWLSDTTKTQQPSEQYNIINEATTKSVVTNKVYQKTNYRWQKNQY